MDLRPAFIPSTGLPPAREIDGPLARSAAPLAPTPAPSTRSGGPGTRPARHAGTHYEGNDRSENWRCRRLPQVRAGRQGERPNRQAVGKSQGDEMRGGGRRSRRWGRGCSDAKGRKRNPRRGRGEEDFNLGGEGMERARCGRKGERRN